MVVTTPTAWTRFRQTFPWFSTEFLLHGCGGHVVLLLTQWGCSGLVLGVGASVISVSVIAAGTYSSVSCGCVVMLWRHGYVWFLHKCSGTYGSLCWDGVSHGISPYSIQMIWPSFGCGRNGVFQFRWLRTVCLFLSLCGCVVVFWRRQRGILAVYG